MLLFSADAIPAGVGTVSEEILEYLKVIAVLAGVAVFAFFVLRFWLPKLTGIRGTPSGPMNIVSRLTLEPRKTLYIVRAASDYVLLAASDAGVQLLTSLDPGTIEAALRELSAKPRAASEFASLIRRRGARPDERAE
jgi:flagellar biogenesis protein FliO